MKIDLHCHTKAIKNGEPKTRNVGKDRFIEAVAGAGVGIVAITNHNHFDQDQYNDFKSGGVENGFIVWPGVELDVKVGEEVKHLVLLASPEEVSKFNDFVNKVAPDSSQEDFNININDLFNTIESDCLDLIYIAHFHDKNKAWTDDEISILENLLDAESYRIFREPGNLRSMRILIDNGINAMLGTDIQDWAKYEDSYFPELRLDVTDFEKFKLLTKKDQTLINSLLNEKKQEDIELELLDDQGKVLDKVPLAIFNDINIIFGNKGTGKTLIEQSLKNHFISRGISYVEYCARDTENAFDLKKIVQDSERDIDGLGIDNCYKELFELVSWQEKVIVSPDSYLKAEASKCNNANRKRLSIMDLTYTGKSPSVSDYETIRGEYSFYSNSHDKYEKADLSKIISDQDKETLLNLMKTISNASHDKLKDVWIRQKSVELLINSLKVLREISVQESGETSYPINTGFYDYAMNHLRLKSCADKILKNINTEIKESRILLGNLDQKGEIYITTFYEMYSASCSTPRGKFKHTGEELKKFRNGLEKINSSFYSSDISRDVEGLKSLHDDGMKDLSCLLGVTKKITQKDGEPYTPSSGEKAILMLLEKLSAESEVYILDEPEKSLSNDYINEVIVPKINILSKKNKIVIIATHNANIAVRTLPYSSIYREYDNGNYVTYSGNPFTDILEERISKKTKSWTDTSMKVLEGGVDAFKERSNIYGSGSKKD